MIAPVPTMLPEFKWFDALRAAVVLLTKRIHYVRGNPNGTEYGVIGDIALRLDGGAGTCLYSKESGTTAVPTNTDWRAV